MPSSGGCEGRLIFALVCALLMWLGIQTGRSRCGCWRLGATRVSDFMFKLFWEFGGESHSRISNASPCIGLLSLKENDDAVEIVERDGRVGGCFVVAFLVSPSMEYGVVLVSFRFFMRYPDFF